MKINEIEVSLRPREKMIREGSNRLTDIELLAIILSYGTKNESVMDLSKRLIKTYGLKRLFNMSYDELKHICGIKEAKATKLMAIFELSRRVLNENNNLHVLNNAKDVFEYVKNDYLFLEYEELTIIFVNKLCKVLSMKKYNISSISKVDIPFRKIILEAINTKSYGIFMIHNHPSGDLRPSIDDIEATKVMAETLRPLDILLFDHIIVGNDDYYSIGEKQKLFS